MCRLLAVEGSTDHTFSLDTYLPEFADECQYQLAPDGSLQEDGCGFSFTVEDFDHAVFFWQRLKQSLGTDTAISRFEFAQDSTGLWHILYLSLLPIWQAVKRFPYQDLPMTQRLMAHARAATVADTKDQLQFNQPHMSEDVTFAFNGSLVNANMKHFRNTFVRAGKFDRDAVPTEKIMTLLQIIHDQQQGSQFPMVTALQELNRLFKTNFSRIHGMNIVATNHEGMFALCGQHQLKDTQYYTLFAGKDAYCDKLSIVSSFPLAGQKLKPMKMGEVFYKSARDQQARILPAVV